MNQRQKQYRLLKNVVYLTEETARCWQFINVVVIGNTNVLSMLFTVNPDP